MKKLLNKAAFYIIIDKHNLEQSYQFEYLFYLLLFDKECSVFLTEKYTVVYSQVAVI